MNGMPLSPLEPGARAGEGAFEALHQAIVSGELPVGHRLRIRDLARELGISTMPVREAIRRLEEQGLAESEPYRGAVVRGLSDRELLDLYAVRTLLETDATMLGIAALTSDDLDELQAELEHMAAALDGADASAYLHHDEAFLSVFYGAGGNAVMLEMIRSLWHRCRPYKLMGVRRELALRNGGDIPEIPRDFGQRVPLLEYQEQLLQAARDRDAGAARQATQESLAVATARIRLRLADEGVEVTG
jgi:DNA-binding GntR family transcriptional regulator